MARRNVEPKAEQLVLPGTGDFRIKEMGEMVELSRNAELAVRAVTCQGDRDFAALRAISAPDVVLEFPYHPNGAELHQGVDEMIKQFSVINVFQSFKIDVVRVFDTGGEEVIVEGRSRGAYKSGRPDYTNHYLFVLSFKDGKLIKWREFYNPLEAMKQNYGTPRPERN